MPAPSSDPALRVPGLATPVPRTSQSDPTLRAPAPVPSSDPALRVPGLATPVPRTSQSDPTLRAPAPVPSSDPALRVPGLATPVPRTSLSDPALRVLAPATPVPAPRSDPALRVPLTNDVPRTSLSDPALRVPASAPPVPRTSLSDPALRVPASAPPVPRTSLSDPALRVPASATPVPRTSLSDPALRVSLADDGVPDEERDADPLAGSSLVGPELAPTSPSSPSITPPTSTSSPSITPPSVSALFRHVATPPAGVPGAALRTNVATPLAGVPGAASRANVGPPPAGVPVAAAARAATSASERFSAWRDQVRHNQRPAPVAASAPPVAAGLPPVHGDPRLSWRDEVVAWSRAVVAGAIEHNPPAAPLIDAVLARFALARQLQPALALLYGAHLCGERGAAPIDVARVLDRQWDEALGKGELAQRGVASFADSRVALAPILLRVLDELPPLLGPLVGEPGPSPLLGPCVTVAPPGESLIIVATRCLAHVTTAILVAHGSPDLAELAFEARAHGAVPLIRLATLPLDLPPEPTIFVVADDEAAAALPRLT